VDQRHCRATIANTAATLVDVAVVGLAMTAFYVGGMYLNDFFDRDIDARERPGRPIHAADIGAGAVSAIGFALLAVGTALLVRFGLLTVIWGLALAGAIVLYDAWHKGNVFAPVIMVSVGPSFIWQQVQRSAVKSVSP